MREAATTISNPEWERTAQSDHNSDSDWNIDRLLLPFIAVFFGFFIVVGMKMGAINMLNTLMSTAYELLLDTVFYIMAVAVLASAVGALLNEFGVVKLINRVLSPFMKPVWGLPGAASVGIITTYLSDNPAIIALANDVGFRKYFKRYQIPALTNLGTAFGMGAIISTFMISLSGQSSDNLIMAVLIGNLAAAIGSIVSCRLMLVQTKRYYGDRAMDDMSDIPADVSDSDGGQAKRGFGMRFIDAILQGGKQGVDLGLSIIPGVLIICSIVLILTNGPSANGTYTGAAYEGIGLLPWIGQKLSFILSPLFGFTSAQAISVPITALGAAGAAIGLVPRLLSSGLAGGNDIAVFTAMCMCWSGYLSTHLAMMDSLKCRDLAGKAILSHTIGGAVAGIAAHLLYMTFSMIF